MGRASFTLKLNPKERAALETLSKIEDRSINQLVNKAIKMYLSLRAPKEPNLARLRVYRKRDPKFKKAIAAFVEAEAGFEDPLEGAITGFDQPLGPVQRRIRKILNA